MLIEIQDFPSDVLGRFGNLRSILLQSIRATQTSADASKLLRATLNTSLRLLKKLDKENEDRSK